MGMLYVFLFTCLTGEISPKQCFCLYLRLVANCYLAITQMPHFMCLSHKILFCFHRWENAQFKGCEYCSFVSKRKTNWDWYQMLRICNYLQGLGSHIKIPRFARWWHNGNDLSSHSRPYLLQRPSPWVLTCQLGPFSSPAHASLMARTTAL